MVLDWGRLGLFGLAWLFQLIASFGAATGFNRGYWLYFAILGGILLDAYWQTMMFISVFLADSSRTAATETTTSTFIYKLI